MEDVMIATHLENLDRQLARVGQILPTLATQDGLENLDRQLARVEQILPTLATLDGLDNLDRRLARVEQILPTLATKEELAAAIAPLATQEGLDELRRHMNVLHEAVRSDIQLIAEHLASDSSKPRKE